MATKQGWRQETTWQADQQVCVHVCIHVLTLETRSPCVAQDGLKPSTLLPQSLECMAITQHQGHGVIGKDIEGLKMGVDSGLHRSLQDNVLQKACDYPVPLCS